MVRRATGREKREREEGAEVGIAVIACNLKRVVNLLGAAQLTRKLIPA